MSDAAFLFHVLEDGRWHAQHEILARSDRERGHGLTVHSRAADLRKRGCDIQCELRRNGHGRVLSSYRMVVLDDGAGAGLASSSSTPPNFRVDDNGLAETERVPFLLPPPSECGRASHRRAEPGHASPSAQEERRALGEGVLPLFECVVDESAGMRGAYSEPDAA